MKKLLFLINPQAGKAEIKVRALEIIDLFVKNGWDVTVRTTQRRMEIPEILARRAGEFQLVVCCGGDGTLNETVEGLLRCGAQVPLGYIPAGTVNDFASSLHLSRNMLEAAQTIVSGVPFCCDVGRFNDRFFTYIAAFGAFTDVAYQTSQEVKNLLGRAAYILEGIKRLPSIKAYHMVVEHDGERVEGDFIFGMATNATSVGGFKMKEKIGVSLSDGLMEVLLVRLPGSLLETQQLINAILRQEFDSEFLTSFRTPCMTVHCDEALPWTLDGEFGGSIADARVQNYKHALQILVNAQA